MRMRVRLRSSFASHRPNGHVRAGECNGFAAPEARSSLRAQSVSNLTWLDIQRLRVLGVVAGCIIKSSSKLDDSSRRLRHGTLSELAKTSSGYKYLLLRLPGFLFIST